MRAKDDSRLIVAISALIAKSRIHSGFPPEEGAAIYNLAGQRVNKMQKGVNIVGGRKVLIK